MPAATPCAERHTRTSARVDVQDYAPHVDPFQYYGSTANPRHLPPSSEAAIGMTDQANHQYDLSNFSETLADGNMPSVSFLSPPAYESGHAGSSDPLDEQNFLVNTVNEIVSSHYWASTAIVITYASSGGWYDHSFKPIVNGSDDSAVDTTMCTSAAITLGSANDRCGYGPRIPLLVLSPYAPANTVSHVTTDQTSIIRFIEDNWLGGTRIGNGSYDAVAGGLDGPGALLNFSATPHGDELILNSTTGTVVSDTTPAPGAPTGVTAAAGDADATVSFTPPADNGSLITGYAVTAHDSTDPSRGGQTASGTASPIIVAGLTDGDSYTFTVVATNGDVKGPPSAPSNSVLPNPLVTLAFSGSLTAHYSSELVTGGAVRITPSSGTVTSIAGTLSIAGSSGGAATVAVVVLRLHNLYRGTVVVDDPGAHLVAVALVQSSAVIRAGVGGDDVSATATGSSAGGHFSLSFTL